MASSKTTGGKGQAFAITVRLLAPALEKVDAWIARQPEPQPSRPEALRKLAELGLGAYRQRISDDRKGRQDESRADAVAATADYANARTAEDQKTERLRVVRLAKEDHDRRVAAGEQRPAKRAAGAQVAKDHAIKAVRKALESVDATDEVKAERRGKLVDRPATGRLRRPTRG